MIRPHRFYSNHETYKDNRFQSLTDQQDRVSTAQRAYDEVTQMVIQLRAAGVQVHLFEDHGERDTPDSVFPNNWFSTHREGQLIIYPMYCANRQREVRTDVIDFLTQHYQLESILDLRPYAHQATFLEGTGSIIFDHTARIAYACLSQRTHLAPLHAMCQQLGYRAHPFHAELDCTPIYHTNVLLSVTSTLAMVGLECIPDSHHQATLCDQLSSTGKEVLSLTREQIKNFAGNTMELQGTNGKLLAISTSAMNSLKPAQLAHIQQHCELLVFNVPTIESAGGSVRCMLAGIHFSRRNLNRG